MNARASGPERHGTAEMSMAPGFASTWPFSACIGATVNAVIAIGSGPPIGDAASDLCSERLRISCARLDSLLFLVKTEQLFHLLDFSSQGFKVFLRTGNLLRSPCFLHENGSFRAALRVPGSGWTTPQPWRTIAMSSESRMSKVRRSGRKRRH